MLDLQETAAKDSKDCGIRWSLPLSHLNYYGSPVLSTGRINDDPAQITFTELLIAALGSFTRKWNLTSVDLSELADFFLVLNSKVLSRFETVDTFRIVYGESASRFWGLAASKLKGPDKENLITIS